MNPIPGQWVSVTVDGNCLKKYDMAKIFTVEKGLTEPLYGLYSYEKDCWELMERAQFWVR